MVKYVEKRKKLNIRQVDSIAGIGKTSKTRIDMHIDQNRPIRLPSYEDIGWRK